MSLGSFGEIGNGATLDQFLLDGGSNGITPNSNRVRTTSKMILWLFDKSMLEAKLVPGASEFVKLDGQLAVVLRTAGAMTSA